MLHGSREAVLRKVQPISVHGQISLDVHYVYPDDDTEQVRVARIGPEAMPRPSPLLPPPTTNALSFRSRSIQHLGSLRNPLIPGPRSGEKGVLATPASSLRALSASGRLAVSNRRDS